MIQRSHVVAMAIIVTAAVAMFVGCGDDDDDTTAPSTTGTIVIDPDPDAVAASWTLTLPNGTSRTGTSGATLESMPVGEYALAWGATAGWITPAPQTHQLAGGATLTCVGDYERGIQPGHEGVDVWITNIYNSRNDHRLRVGGWADYYYSMVRFDLADLPATATSASIRLYTWGNDAATNVSMELHRVTSAWSEGTGWLDQPTTENLRTIAQPTLAAWYEIDITDLYNGWQAGTFANHGVQLRPTGISHQFNEFYSSDYDDEAHLRPKLVVVP